MNRMESETLREKAVESITDFDIFDGPASVWPVVLVDHILAALGLDDLDAAVERGGMALDPDAWTGDGYGPGAAAQSRNSARESALAVLEAALTATGESDV